MTIPNRITIVRILCIPVFVMMAMYYGKSVQRGDPQDWQRWCAVAIFILAAASDGVDGYIARRFNMRSKLGVILDPIADKGLLLAAVITLSLSNWRYEFPIWFPVLVIARDAVIVVGTIVLHLLVGTVHVRPSWMGKVATFLQMTAIGFVMFQWNLFHHTLRFGRLPVDLDFLDIPVALAGLFTLISGVGYVRDGIRQLQAHGHAQAK